MRSCFAISLIKQQHFIRTLLLCPPWPMLCWLSVLKPTILLTVCFLPRTSRLYSTFTNSTLLRRVTPTQPICYLQPAVSRFCSKSISKISRKIRFMPLLLWHMDKYSKRQDKISKNRNNRIRPKWSSKSQPEVSCLPRSSLSCYKGLTPSFPSSTALPGSLFRPSKLS